MPVYEYQCLDCHKSFELMRSIKDSDAEAICLDCHSTHTRRKLSTFFAHGERSGGAADFSSGPSGSGCGGCSGGNCSTCCGH